MTSSPVRRSSTSHLVIGHGQRRQGLAGRKRKRRRGLTHQDRSAAKFPDLLHRDFSAPAPNVRWSGDITEIPTDGDKLYLATVIDLFSRRLLASATSGAPTQSWLATRARWPWQCAADAPPSTVSSFITDRGSTYTTIRFTTLCRTLGVSQSMGRVGSCLLTGSVIAEARKRHADKGNA